MGSVAPDSATSNNEAKMGRRLGSSEITASARANLGCTCEDGAGAWVERTTTGAGRAGAHTAINRWAATTTVR